MITKSRYDAETDTWDDPIGTCPYCNIQLYENEGLNTNVVAAGK